MVLIKYFTYFCARIAQYFFIDSVIEIKSYKSPDMKHSNKLGKIFTVRWIFPISKEPNRKVWFSLRQINWNFLVFVEIRKA
jgi:hypothetical protein